MIINLMQRKPVESGDILCFSQEEVFLIIDNDTGYSAVDLEYNTIYFTSKTIEHLVDALQTNCGSIVGHFKSKDILLTIRK